mmetsp:Transcript_17286/g.31010  ORF Transcript_17286/g.31010 Transcript_17286/m.31010 type:complete len:275 (+) Transcript_17286:43-867(+)|eukprot:CAMPEP_0197526830 /NCGR_PEP_ID=MMETSP1318-20131121/19507_1 /TAXON_ID=552666 /ORGANISM="Partenskyella glossopodia, Strain RCC365" /LENGTH=274 /DNA_ID=CAMNT_0043081187 /DNA_START=10 /DNA_END=834 /DNA_ORIENTATION=+
MHAYLPAPRRDAPKFILLCTAALIGSVGIFSLSPGVTEPEPSLKYNVFGDCFGKKATPPPTPSPVDKAKKFGAIGIGALATAKIACSLFSKGGSVGKLPGQTFVGGGVRAKGPISVYNVNMFIGNRAKSSLSAYKGKDLKKEKGFIDTFEKSGFQKTIQIKMLRSVAPSKMVSSFNEAVSSRMPKSQFDKLSSSLDSLLNKAFDKKSSSKGAQITFSMAGGTAFSISVDGKSKGSIWSSALCKAFTDIYVGPKSVTPGARESIFSGVKAMLEKK